MVLLMIPSAPIQLGLIDAQHDAWQQARLTLARAWLAEHPAEQAELMTLWGGLYREAEAPNPSEGLAQWVAQAHVRQGEVLRLLVHGRYREVRDTLLAVVHGVHA